MVFLKDVFVKVVDFEKKTADDKKHEKLPSCTEGMKDIEMKKII